MRPLQGHGHDLARLPAAYPVPGLSRLGREATGMNQADRLLRFLRDNPGSSSLEITLSCDIVNVTGRISDLRAAGKVIDCRKRRDGRDGYWLVEQPEQIPLGIAS